MRLIPLVFALLLFAAPGPSLAQAQPLDASVRATVDQAQSDLHAVSSGLHGASVSDAELKSRLARIPPIQASLAQALSVLTPRLQDADARLAQLGPAPAAGQPPESPEAAASRRNLTRAHEVLDGEVKLTRLLSVEADQTSKAILEQLRRNFDARLWTRSRSVIDPGLWRDFAGALPDDVGRLSDVFAAEGRRFAVGAAEPGHPAVLALGFLAGLLLLIPARIVLTRLGYSRTADVVPGSRLRRSILALWLVLVAALTPVASGVLIHAALTSAGALTDDFGDLISLTIRAVGFAALLEGLGRALLSPGRPSWRLAPIPDAVVERLAPYPTMIGVATGVATLVAGFNTALGSNLATSVASDCLTVGGMLAAVGAALTAMAHLGRERLAAGGHNAPHQGESRLPWILAALAAWISLGVSIIAILTGYLALATFLMRETIWIAVVLAILFLILRFVDDAFPALLSTRSPIGRLARTAIGFSEGALEQIGVLASGVVRLAVLLFGWAAILAPFGASVDDIVSRITSTQVVLKLGQVSISPGAVLGAIGLFLVGLALTRAVRGWLEVRYLPKTSMDVGVRTSLAAAVSYLGVGIAVLLTFGYLGLSFSQIALFASALSVGIGFGLQAIIGNFVSGLILLAERPVKVGDWIAIGDLEGDVKAINIRATEIEMADKSKLIVPNSDLISKTVRNVTHSGALGRVRIVLRVGGTADPAQVRDLLTARLKGHAEVLHEPAPGVYLSDVRDGGLEFSAFAYVASPRQAFRVKSDLLFQIVADLKAHNVALANPNPVVNVGLQDRTIEPEPTPEAETP